MRINQAGDMEAVIKAGGLRPFISKAMYKRWSLLPRWEVRGSVAAYINHSRWIARCPFCPGALTVSEDDPVFFCVDCGMQANGGGPGTPGCAMAVQFPENMREIEAVLVDRPDPTTRNWFPHELVADLIRENIEHGVCSA